MAGYNQEQKTHRCIKIGLSLNCRRSIAVLLFWISGFILAAGVLLSQHGAAYAAHPSLLAAPVYSCGNKKCEAGENADNCPEDCQNPVKSVCGNGACEAGENKNNCPQDCPPDPPNSVCGNGVCESGENNNSCPQDCAPPPETPVSSCGNGFCDTPLGENQETCPHDCLLTSTPYLPPIPTLPNPPCGNGVCQPGQNENPQTCPADCLPVATPDATATDTPTATATTEKPTATSTPVRTATTLQSPGGASTSGNDGQAGNPANGQPALETVGNCRIVSFEELAPAVQDAFLQLDLDFKEVTTHWLICEKIPPEACIPLVNNSGETIEELHLVDCTPAGGCSVHPVTMLSERNQACSPTASSDRLTCLTGCTVIADQFPAFSPGFFLTPLACLLVSGGVFFTAYLLFSRRHRDIDETYEDIC